jgi:predicted kinase
VHQRPLQPEGKTRVSEPVTVTEGADKPPLALVITRGLPASGKTTWARRWVADDLNHRARVNRDDLRQLLHQTTTYEWPQEKAVTEASHASVRALLAAGISVVVDDMNLRQRYVRTWREIAADHSAVFQTVDFETDVEECVRRDTIRWDQTAVVGEQFIRNMAGRYLRNGKLPTLDGETITETRPGRYVPDVAKPQAVLVDVDGTLALVNGRGYYDYDLVLTDLPNQPVIDLVNVLARDNEIIFMSGRPETCREDTSSWIDRFVRYPHLLFMRAEGDKRKDAVVKRELFDERVRNHYNVRWVVDDRNQVVRMWRELGLTVLQVADGAF